MLEKLGKWLLLLGMIGLGYMLYVQLGRVDFSMHEKFEASEQQRHHFVLSHDFDELKGKLIEVHRDYWIEKSRLESQSRYESLALGGLLLLLSLFFIQQIRKRSHFPHTKTEN